MTLRNSEKHEHLCFDVFAKVKGDWPIANWIRNVILIFLAVPNLFLKPRKNDKEAVCFLSGPVLVAVLSTYR